MDQTPELLDEPWIHQDSKIVDSWGAALDLLDEYPWHRLLPVEVHPDLHDAVSQAFMERNDASPSRYASQWRQLLLLPKDE